jgi:hypothetical protein
MTDEMEADIAKKVREMLMPDPDKFLRQAVRNAFNHGWTLSKIEDVVNDECLWALNGYDSEHERHARDNGR